MSFAVLCRSGARVRVLVLFAILTASTILVGSGRDTDHSNLQPIVQSEELDLHDAMAQIGQSFRFLNRNIDLPEQQAACLEKLSTLQDLAMTCRLIQPAVIQDAPEDQKISMMTEYRLLLVNLLRASLDLEEAILTEDLAAADRAISAMTGVMEQGHDTFIPQ